MNRRIWFAALFAFGCGTAADEESTAASIRLVDDLGIEVELEAPAQRLVSLAPSNTELLFALGLGERLVGVTEQCNYPPPARRIEKVAGYSSLNAEKIVAVHPDLVLAIRGNDPEGLETLRKLGIAVFALEIQSVEQLFAALERVGRLTGAEGEARTLGDSLRRRVERVAAPAQSTRPRVMWGHWGEPIYTAGKNTFIDDVIRLAGGENVGARAPGAWPQVSLETVVSWAPEVIITTMTRSAALPVQIDRLQKLEGWKALPAVQKRRIYYLEPDLLLRPGPRVVEALEALAALLRGERAPDR